MRWIAVPGLFALCVAFTGCFGFLKPAQSSARSFLLAPLPAPATSQTAAHALAVGVGRVKVPDYLFSTSIAVRRGANEVEYLPAALWAERLDSGVQRVLAANLAMLIPTDQIRQSSWNRREVAAEVYVAIQQFDVDESGRGVLVADWRIVPPGGDKPLKSGTARLHRDGPSPEDDPSGAVTTLSQLLAEFTQQLVEPLKATIPDPASTATR